MDPRDIIWDGAAQEPHEFPAPSHLARRRDRVKAWLAHQRFVHRLLDVALVGALPGLGAYARFVAPHTLELMRTEVPVPDLDPALDGVRIVQISDLHVGENVPPGFVARAFELALSTRPDAVALTGDFLQWDPFYIETLAELLTRLHAPLGVFAVLGNHDFGVNSPNGPVMLPDTAGRLEDAMTAAGVCVLRNAWSELPVATGALSVVGVDDLWCRSCDPDAAFGGCPDGPRVLLCHNPDGFGFGARHRFELMLSGHTHGAQVRLGGATNAVLPLRDRRLMAGFYGRPGSWLYVNRGLGYIWKVRLNSAPEIVCHTLRTASDAIERPRRRRALRERWKAA